MILSFIQSSSSHSKMARAQGNTQASVNQVHVMDSSAAAISAVDAKMPPSCPFDYDNQHNRLAAFLFLQLFCTVSALRITGLSRLLTILQHQPISQLATRLSIVLVLVLVVQLKQASTRASLTSTFTLTHRNARERLPPPRTPS